MSDTFFRRTCGHIFSTRVPGPCSICADKAQLVAQLEFAMTYLRPFKEVWDNRKTEGSGLQTKVVVELKFDDVRNAANAFSHLKSTSIVLHDTR